MGAMKPYYEDSTSGITIYHADCRDVLPTLEAGSIDSVITDPPWGVDLKAKRAVLGHGNHRTTVRLGEYSHPDTPEYLRTVVLPVIEECRRLYPSAALTPGVRNLWMYPSADDLGCFFSAAGTGMSKWGFTCMQPILYYGKDPYLARGLGSRPNSFGQTYPNDANQHDHPCAKPIRLMLWLVNRASLEGMTVLDPFMGSGTTLVAAKRLGRRCVGIEVEEKYCEIAAQRLSQGVLTLEPRR